jgi:hypothetical protein
MFPKVAEQRTARMACFAREGFASRYQTLMLVASPYPDKPKSLAPDARQSRQDVAVIHEADSLSLLHLFNSSIRIRLHYSGF